MRLNKLVYSRFPESLNKELIHTAVCVSSVASCLLECGLIASVARASASLSTFLASVATNDILGHFNLRKSA